MRRRISRASATPWRPTRRVRSSSTQSGRAVPPGSSRNWTVPSRRSRSTPLRRAVSLLMVRSWPDAYDATVDALRAARHLNILNFGLSVGRPGLDEFVARHAEPVVAWMA